MSYRLEGDHKNVNRWRIESDFKGSLKGIFTEGSFFLTFSRWSNIASFQWTGISKSSEINFVINVKVERVGGKKLLDQSWQVDNLRCGGAAVDLTGLGEFDHWKFWDFVEVKIRDITRVDRSRKATESRCITKGEFQRAASTSVATKVVVKLESGKQSDPIKSIVKPQQIQSAKGQVDHKSHRSAVVSESTGQPPAKKRKTDQSSTAANKIDSSSAAPVDVVPSPSTKSVGGDNTNSSDDAHFMQAAAAKVSQLSQLREENTRLTSSLSKLQRKLNEIDVELESKLTEKTAEMRQLQLKCERLELERNTQVGLVADLHTQLSAKSEENGKINDELVMLRKESAHKQSELDQSKVELNKLVLELSDQQQLNNRNVEEIGRQSSLIEEKSRLEDSLRAQLSNQTGKVQRLRTTLNRIAIDRERGNNAAVANMQLNQVGRDNQIEDEAEANLPPVFPGWTTDFPDSNLISSDNFTFPVSRGVLSLKSPVFKAEFSTQSAQRNGLVQTTFSGDVLLELSKFLCGQKFSENLPVVAKKLIKAAQHYRLTELKGICEEEVAKQLSFETLPFIIRLADEFSSDRLMSETFRFVKKGKKNEQMWKDLRPIGAEFPNLFGQICAFSGSGKNTKCPKFQFSAEINHT